MGSALSLIYAPIFAHFGHWYVSLPTFLGPVAIIAAVVKASERRERRRARDGDSSRVRVAVTECDGRTVLTVTGALDYPALIDIEHELGVAVRRDPHVLLDLRSVTAIAEEDFAWSVADALNSVEDADVTVLIGSAPAARALRKMSAVEGIKLLDDPVVAAGAPASADQEA
ncbi:MAG: hypothetical protein ACHQC8_00970 [Solirubrobacterales bacterium]